LIAVIVTKKIYIYCLLVAIIQNNIFN